MKKTHNLVAVTGTYTDASGQEKKRYVTIGAAFTGPDGQMSLKLEAVPVGQGWNGWVNLYEPRQQDRPNTPAPNAPAREPGSDDFKDNDLSELDTHGKVPFGD